MKRIMVRYKVKPEFVAENERDIKRVFEQLAGERPPGVRYASFKLADGVSFMHIVSLETTGDPSPDPGPLRKLPAFNAFTAAVEKRCAEHPVVTNLTEVGSYQMFGD
jgi:hypothetical protein